MSVSGIEGFTPLAAPQLGASQLGSALRAPGIAGIGEGSTGVAGIDTASGVQAARGADFGAMVLDGIDRLEGLQDRTDQLAVKAATGDLGAIHDYTIAATETAVTTQLTVAVRNKALEAFSEIMRMHVG